MSDGLSIEELARRNPLRGFLFEVLRDEQRRGHVEPVDGGWRATAAFVETFGGAFGYLTPPMSKETKGERR